MWTFVISGALYLVGVAIVLVLKPSFMFTPDGTWKEFGIGQDSKRYTSFPFWLFCLVWALISYVLVLLLLPLLIDLEESEVEVNPENVYKPRSKRRKVDNSDLVFDDEVETLPRGYYVLNKKASRISGTPKYVYLGPEEPEA